MKNYVRIMAALGALLVSSAALVARAQDAKSMAGGACIPLVPAGSAYNPWPWFGAYATNQHTSDLTYICATLPRDNETTTTGLASATASLRIQPSRTVACTIRSLSKFGLSLDFVTKNRTNTAAVVEDYDMAFGNGLNLSQDSGAYALSCVLSPAARVLTYRWAEN